jgi:hypothetical protein
MSHFTSTHYQTINWPAYNASLKSRGSLEIWLDPKLNWYAAPTGKQGRNPNFSDETIQFCLTLKVLFQLPLRQTIGLVGSILKLSKLDWEVPDYSTLCRRQKKLSVKIAYQKSKGGLHLLVDSTGVKILGEGEWKRKKHGAEYRRQWRKVHLGIDADSLEIRAVQLTGNRIGDASVLPDLLSRIPLDEEIAFIGGDGAYDTKKCHEAICARHADAIIPTRKNANFWKEKTPGAKARNEIFALTQHLGRTIWRRWSGYYRRSLVGCKMRCLKLLGERLMARDFNRQITEVHIRAAILNRFTQLGTPTTIRVT